MDSDLERGLGEEQFLLNFEPNVVVVDGEGSVGQDIALGDQGSLDVDDVAVLDLVLEEASEGANYLLSVDTGQPEHDML